MVAILKLLSSKEEYMMFINQIDDLFSEYSSRFSVINFDDIIQLSGFTTDWKSILVNSILNLQVVY